MRNELKDLHLVVLMGGPGSENAVSLRSGAAVANALRQGGYRVSEVEVHGTDITLPPDTGLCVNMIHGTFGEDGGLQSLLDARRIAYTGEGAAASRLATASPKPLGAFRPVPTAVPPMARSRTPGRLSRIALRARSSWAT